MEIVVERIALEVLSVVVGAALLQLLAWVRHQLSSKTASRSLHMVT